MAQRAYNSVKVKVTEDIIKHSAVKDSSHCMIAEAVKASLPGVHHVSVDVATIRFTVTPQDPAEPVRRYTYITPRVGQLALLDFDMGRKDIAPFEFTIRSPHISNRRRKGTPRTKPYTYTPAVEESLAKARKANPSHQISKARLAADPTSATNIPSIVAGSKSPPTGALASGSGQRRRDGDVSTARARRFGLRAMGDRERAVPAGPAEETGEE